MYLNSRSFSIKTDVTSYRYSEGLRAAPNPSKVKENENQSDYLV
jgi:hypothetical protein